MAITGETSSVTCWFIGMDWDVEQFKTSFLQHDEIQHKRGVTCDSPVVLIRPSKCYSSLRWQRNIWKSKVINTLNAGKD